MDLRVELIKRGLWDVTDLRDPSKDRKAYVQMTSRFSCDFLDRCCQLFGADENCESSNLDHARYHLVKNIIKCYDSLPNKSPEAVYSM